MLGPREGAIIALTSFGNVMWEQIDLINKVLRNLQTHQARLTKALVRAQAKLDEGDDIGDKLDFQNKTRQRRKNVLVLEYHSKKVSDMITHALQMRGMMEERSPMTWDPTLASESIGSSTSDPRSMPGTMSGPPSKPGTMETNEECETPEPDQQVWPYQTDEEEWKQAGWISPEIWSKFNPDDEETWIPFGWIPQEPTKEDATDTKEKPIRQKIGPNKKFERDDVASEEGFELWQETKRAGAK